MQIATLPVQYGLYSSFVGVLIYPVRFLLPNVILYSQFHVVLRHIQGRFHRASRRHVSYNIANHLTCPESPPGRVGRSSNCDNNRVYLWFHCPWHWLASVGMDRRIHPPSGREVSRAWLYRGISSNAIVFLAVS